MLESLAAMTSGRTVAADQLGQLFASIREQLEQLEVETMTRAHAVGHLALFSAADRTIGRGMVAAEEVGAGVG